MDRRTSSYGPNWRHWSRRVWVDLGLSLLVYAVVMWLILPDDQRYLIVVSLPVAVVLWLLGQRYRLKRRQNADRGKV